MFESKDILNYSLTIAVLVLTFFTAWILLYFVKIFRETERIMRDFVSAIEKFNSVLDFTKDKISNAASVIPLMIKGGEKVFDMLNSMHEKKQEKKSKKTKSKTKSDDNEEL